MNEATTEYQSFDHGPLHSHSLLSTHSLAKHSLTNVTMTTSMIQCHYDVLSVPRNADAVTIKKAHRKLAIKFHPDKNLGDEQATDRFRLVQQAYECLSDTAERKWYDEHRDAILKGWSASKGGSAANDDLNILFDVTPFMYAGCFKGNGDDEKGFFAVYREVFQKIYEGEEEGAYRDESEGSKHYLQSFGTSDSSWADVRSFYQSWESFTSCLSFAWADQYDAKEGDSRRVRRAMEDENRKSRRAAKRARNEDIEALVHFVKRRDPRVKAFKESIEQETLLKQRNKKADALRKKQEAKEAREQWRMDAEESMAAAEAEDLALGRVRLADLEDDYDYGGKKGKRGKKSKKKSSQWEEDEDEHAGEGADGETNVAEEGEVQEGGEDGDDKKEAQAGAESAKEVQEGDDGEAQLENAEAEVEASDESVEEQLESDYESSSSSEEEEPDVWRCECCRKDFKSKGQMENHVKSKKHKEAYKKYKKIEHKLMEEMLDETEIKD